MLPNKINNRWSPKNNRWSSRIGLPGQKKVEVARGVIELGQILIDTKEKLPHGSWIKWLEDSRVGFTDRMARKYMKITRELGEAFSHTLLDNLSLNKLYTLASAPEEVKEDVANSKDLQIPPMGDIWVV